MSHKLLALALCLFLPLLGFARVDEYSAEKAFYRARRLQKKLISDKSKEHTPQDYQKVISAFRAVLKRFPEWTQKIIVHQFIGDLHTANKQYPEAKEAYLEIIRLGYEKMMANLPVNTNLSAQARYKIALNYEAQDNWSEAENNFNKIIEDYPQTLIALFTPIYVAEHYFKENNPQKAEQIYQEALGRFLDIIDQSPHSRLALAARKMIEKSYENVKKWEEMATTLLQAIKDNPNAKVAYIELGKIYQKQNKNEEAISSFKKVIERYPDYYEAHLELGRLYVDLGRYDLALEIAEGVLARQEYNLGAITLKGYAFFYKRAYGDALKHLKRAIHLGSKAPEIYNLIGVIQLNFKRYEEAREALEASLLLQPNSAAVHVNLGNLYLAEEKLDQAEQEYRKALAQDDKHLEAYANLANLKIRSRKLDKALDIYQTMLEINSQLHLVEYHIGEVYEFKEEYEQAIEQYKKTITALPKYWESYNNLAYIYASQGKNLEEALKLIKKADELRQENSSVLDTMGYVYFKMKKYQPAAKSYSRALALTPKHPYILFHLGVLNREINQPKQAKKYFKEALANGLKGKLAAEAKQHIKEL